MLIQLNSLLTTPLKGIAVSFYWSCPSIVVKNVTPLAPLAHERTLFQV